MGGKRGKNGPKGPEWQKLLSVSLCISGTLNNMIVIFGVFEGGKRAKNDLKFPISVCFPHMSETVDHIIESSIFW